MNREELVAAYTAPGRHYHNLSHIEDCLGALARVDNLSAAEREILSEAIWWHDVVYDATRSDNEELSAHLAEQHVREDLRQEVGRLIRLTQTHDVQPDDHLGASGLQRVFQRGFGARIRAQIQCRSQPGVR